MCDTLGIYSEYILLAEDDQTKCVVFLQCVPTIQTTRDIQDGVICLRPTGIVGESLDKSTEVSRLTGHPASTHLYDPCTAVFLAPCQKRQPQTPRSRGAEGVTWLHLQMILRRGFATGLPKKHAYVLILLTPLYTWNQWKPPFSPKPMSTDSTLVAWVIGPARQSMPINIGLWSRQFRVLRLISTFMARKVQIRGIRDRTELSAPCAPSWSYLVATGRQQPSARYSHPRLAFLECQPVRSQGHFQMSCDAVNRFD